MEPSGDYRTTLADFILSKVHDEAADELWNRLCTVTNQDDCLHRTYAKPNNQKLTLLMMACLEDRQDIVQILLEHFELDLEVLNDVFLIPKNHSASLFSDVTTLWVAAARDNLELVKLLVEHGARVNHTTKTNSTALRCACGTGNLEVARYLIQNGADVNITKEHHDTNLLIAVFEQNLAIVHYLVEELDCDINEFDEEGRSPLYEAVKCGSVELVEYLLKQGARNFRNISSQFSPLLLAAENRRTDLMEMISVHCSLLEQVEAKELLGSSFACRLADEYDPDQALIQMSQALELRAFHQLPKTLTSPTLEIFNHRQECQTVEQLEQVWKNTDNIRIEALLVRRRLLGSMDEEYRHSVRLWGAGLLDEKQYDRGLAICLYVTELQREHSLPLESHVLRCFVDVFAQMVSKSLALSIDAVHTVFKLLTEALSTNSEDYDDHLHSLLFLITITAQILYKSTDYSSTHRQSLLRQVRSLIQRPFVTRADGSSLLHLSVNRSVSSDDRYIDQCCQYPCEYTVRLLLQCGVDVNAMNATRDTPLHTLLVYSRPGDNNTIIQRLCDADAHLDCVNALGETPADITAYASETKLLKSYMKLRLKCVCARLIQKCEIPYDNKLTPSLIRFVQLH